MVTRLALVSLLAATCFSTPVTQTHTKTGTRTHTATSHSASTRTPTPVPPTSPGGASGNVAFYVDATYDDTSITTTAYTQLEVLIKAALGLTSAQASTATMARVNSSVIRATVYQSADAEAVSNAYVSAFQQSHTVLTSTFKASSVNTITASVSAPVSSEAGKGPEVRYAVVGTFNTTIDAAFAVLLAQQMKVRLNAEGVTAAQLSNTAIVHAGNQFAIVIGDDEFADNIRAKAVVVLEAKLSVGGREYQAEKVEEKGPKYELSASYNTTITGIVFEELKARYIAFVKAKGSTEADLATVTYARADATMYVRIMEGDNADTTASRFEEAMKEEYSVSGSVYAAAAVERREYEDDGGSLIVVIIIVIVLLCIVAIVVGAVLYLLHRRQQQYPKVAPQPHSEPVAVAPPAEQQPAVAAGAAA